MKLATIRNGSRDGELVLVSKNLRGAVYVPDIALTMQKALDQWDKTGPLLQQRYDQLNSGGLADVFAFSECELESPLPRAYQWVDGSAYVNHVELVRKARGAEMPESFWTDPLIYQGGSDSFLGPADAIPLQDQDWGLDFEAEVAIITGDVAMGVSRAAAQKSILLIVLVNDISLRNLIPPELAKGFGFFQSKPSSAFSPVAVTPDELGDAWDGSKINLPLCSYLNNQLFGRPDAGIDMIFDFPMLMVHAAKTRTLMAGTIVGSGTVSNKDRSVGSSCIAEKRMLEKIEDGSISSPFLKVGDQVRIEMFNDEGESVFGAIDQRVAPLSSQK